MSAIVRAAYAVLVNMSGTQSGIRNGKMIYTPLMQSLCNAINAGDEELIASLLASPAYVTYR